MMYAVMIQKYTQFWYDESCYDTMCTEFLYGDLVKVHIMYSEGWGFGTIYLALKDMNTEV